MGAETGIQWTDATWNPVRGCSRISPGCENCYAETMAARFSTPGQWAHGFALRSPARWTRKVELVPEMLDLPLRWKKPRRIFVNSMSDLFHESLSNEAIAAVFGVMAACPQHTFQILTKRAARLPEWFAWLDQQPAGHGVDGWACTYLEQAGFNTGCGSAFDPDDWPLPNVWLGVSVEDQQRADDRIPHLLRTPAAVRFLSCEPLLGPVELDATPAGDALSECDCRGKGCDACMGLGRVDWCIVGGESGPGARPMHVEWARSIVEQCKAASVAVFVKQMGTVPVMDEAAWRQRSYDGLGTLVLNHRNHRRAPAGTVPLMFGFDSKGGDPAEWPADLRVREFPEAR